MTSWSPGWSAATAFTSDSPLGSVCLTTRFGAVLAQSGERFAFIEAPDALQEPLAAQHFVQTGDATSEAVRSIDRILHAQRWANEWLGEVIMLYDWAKAAGMKTIYFGRIFKSETGQRPMEWLNERRL